MIELKGKYTNAVIYADTIEEGVVAQIQRVLNHPIFKDCKVRIMPDVHVGKGCTIGFTSEMPKGGEVIPNIIGVDQSCRISAIKIKECKTTRDYLKLDKVIQQFVPFGTGGKRKELHRLSKSVPELNEGIVRGCKDILKENPEDHFLKLGTTGSGNHFLSLEKGKTGLYLLVHSGSRNFGNRLAIEFQKRAIEKHCYGEGVEKELSFLDGKDTEEYLYYAHICNLYSDLSHAIVIDEILSNMNWESESAITTVHNYINLEDNIIRKGAISCKENEKVIIPINMAYGSFLAIGKGNPEWNNSGPHGAGRVLSRSKAKDTLSMEDYKESMKGIHSCCITTGTLDEAPMAYKDGDEIERLIEPTANIYDHLIPVYNYKA